MLHSNERRLRSRISKDVEGCRGYSERTVVDVVGEAGLPGNNETSTNTSSSGDK